MATRNTSHAAAVVIVGLITAVGAVGVGVALLAVLFGLPTPGTQCAGNAAAPSSGILLGPPGSGQLAGATEYGGPADPSSGTIGASGQSLVAHPDSYAELGGYTFQTARALGGLPYMTPLRITWGKHSAIAYKRDFGFGGGPIDGLPRVIDLWWQFAVRLGIRYPWAGPVSIERPPVSGAAAALGQMTQAESQLISTPPVAEDPARCDFGAPTGVPLTPGSEARLLSDGQAAAPADAPAEVKEIIAAGNQIVGKPYLYGGGHGLPLSGVAPAYDCSSSVEHLLYGARLLPVGYDAASGTLETFGAPGPGQWVTIYASPDHVFMYVAGLRWDTHNAAGPEDGSAGIGWHPLIRSSAGFVARHPLGL